MKRMSIYLLLIFLPFEKLLAEACEPNFEIIHSLGVYSPPEYDDSTKILSIPLVNIGQGYTGKHILYAQLKLNDLGNFVILCYSGIVENLFTGTNYDGLQSKARYNPESKELIIPFVGVGVKNIYNIRLKYNDFNGFELVDYLEEKPAQPERVGCGEEQITINKYNEIVAGMTVSDTDNLMGCKAQARYLSGFEVVYTYIVGSLERLEIDVKVNTSPYYLGSQGELEWNKWIEVGFSDLPIPPYTSKSIDKTYLKRGVVIHSEVF